MRIVFMGTPDFALRQLNELISAGHDIVLVVTAPERPAGRGRHATQSPVEKAAIEKGLPLITPENVNAEEVIQRIAAAKPEVAVVAAFGQVLSRQLLALPPLGFFNVHPSLLPKYRGAAPINRALINGDLATGVTVQTVVPKVDAGAITAQQEVVIDPRWNVTDLTHALAEAGATLVKWSVAELQAGTLQLHKQPRIGISKAPRLTKSDGIIDWTKSAEEIHNLVRGVTPWPGAQTWHGEEPNTKMQLLLTRTEVVAETQVEMRPGEVVGVSEAGLDVACGKGVLRVLKLKPAGKREMSAGEFLHGHRWRPGDRLVGTP